MEHLRFSYRKPLPVERGRSGGSFWTWGIAALFGPVCGSAAALWEAKRGSSETLLRAKIQNLPFLNFLTEFRCRSRFYGTGTVRVGWPPNPAIYLFIFFNLRNSPSKADLKVGGWSPKPGTLLSRVRARVELYRMHGAVGTHVKTRCARLSRIAEPHIPH